MHTSHLLCCRFFSFLLSSRLSFFNLLVLVHLAITILLQHISILTILKTNFITLWLNKLGKMVRCKYHMREPSLIGWPQSASSVSTQFARSALYLLCCSSLAVLSPWCMISKVSTASNRQGRAMLATLPPMISWTAITLSECRN